MQQLAESFGRWRFGAQPVGHLALRQLQYLAIPREVDEPERRHAGLARAKEVSGAANHQVPFGDLEPVGRLRHRAQPRSGIV